MSIVNPATQSLDSIVDIVENLAQAAAPRSTFNQMLIVGPATVIPYDERVRMYDKNFATEMIADGFITTDAEYKAMALYFSQSPAPTVGWVGVQVASAIKTAAVNAGGEGYSVGDVLTAVQSSAEGGTARVATIINGELKTLSLSAQGTGYVANDIVAVAGGTGGTLKVLTVDTGKVVTFEIHEPGSGYAIADGVATTGAGTGFKIDIEAIADGVVGTATILTRGTGYSIASGLATTVSPSGGTGCTIDVVSIGETPLQALTACRNINYEWYVGVCSEAAKTDHLACAAYAQSAQPSMLYAFTTSEIECLIGSDDVFYHLKALGYDALGQYSTNNALAICAVIGYAMGQNSGLDNSAFTLKFKGEIGIETEALTPSHINILKGNNANLYLSYANFYKFFGEGILSSGKWADDKINYDMLRNDLQLGEADLLNGSPKVSQTDAGALLEIMVANEACQRAVARGYLAPGKWTGSNILALKTGDTLSKGFLVQAPPYALQSIADRDARKSVPLYIAIHRAGAVHSLLIGLYVD